MSATPHQTADELAQDAPRPVAVDGLVVADNAELSRFEGRVGGELAAVAVYSAAPRFLVFSHTEVLSGFESRGIASAVVRHALEEVRERGLTAVPLCPFVARWIQRHPEYSDVVQRTSTRVPRDED
ncbi:N-acetyltransferase [Paenibacillus sp. TRM 82003]|uniref:GNAT family N-acetyltransferase n=1 Tax=Kineococcus sp. TRM81007 TaxID=2925831 RepID=UPI001F57D810|nr:GNAT family N-acetyltransferase [Kineococcus sp. TRM81007]MCI2237864.1 N-acetyltransferase [Kineococcus sp. TRM81007]MCI3924595.1 N-acetyltransferase [Paenibacillus sp. TRM 82003]